MDSDKKKLITVGQNIRRIRTEKGLSQEKFAAVASFDRTYISLVERGLRNPSLLNLLRIAGALNVNICELLRGL